jgi:hypothetical protein
LSTTPTKITMNPRYKGYKEIFWLHFNWLVNYFFLYRIVLKRLMEHMYVLVYHKKIKYHLLTEKVYPLKI